MRGQWIGKAEGANEGVIVANIDELSSHYQGMVYLNEANSLLPSIAAALRTKNKDRNFEFRTDWLLPVNPQTGLPVLWDSIKHLYGASVFVSKFADVVGSFENDILKFSWTAEGGNKGNCVLPKENGAFFSLVQHHGYPTPLLDWTYSPYVAAFFAYRSISNNEAAKADEAHRVRILVFDQEKWKTDWTQLQILTPASLHLSLGEFLAIENERMIPQQSASTVTNIDDIESYIKTKDSGGKKYLRAIDLPIRDRAQVVRELNYMGTWSVKFP